MAENLNYDAGNGSVCYDSLESNCNIYGRLYDWITVMSGTSSSSLNPSGVRGVCPDGWHIPSDDEWTALTDFAGGASTACTQLRSTSGWTGPNGVSGNGTNEYGFSALPGGEGINGGFNNVGGLGLWWSATEGGSSNAWNRSMRQSAVNVGRLSVTKRAYYSVRCVQDN